MNSERVRVLFVDDEEHNLQALRATFRREMDVLLASSGADALEMLRREKVHVVISDQRMPGMTGSELLAIVRQHHPETMRMLLTGYADMEAVVAAVNNGGIYAYATKPWDENDLRLRINQAFEIHQLRAEKDRLLHQYRQVFDASGDPIVLVDEKCRVLEANTACERLLGLPTQQLIGQPFSAYIEDPRALVASLRNARKGREFLNVDLTLRTAEGATIDCLMTATYLGRRNGSRSAFQAIIKDITDRKQEEKRLRKLNADLDKRVAVRTAQLLEALEDIGSFSYTVAHDLRSPLKNITALSQHLRDHALEGADPGEVVEFSERISKGTARLIELVDDLLRFSQSNTRQIERGQIVLRDLVHMVVEEQVPEERRRQVHVELAPDATVLADGPMLKVVLHNLLSNALKFSRTVAEPHIVIGLRTEEGRDIISVSDNGVGFDPKHNEQVFGAFKRLHNANQFEGTGVGLAIVHRVVGRHGGEVWAESRVDHGTTIHVALPNSLQERRHPPFFKVA
jgi:PAS domain S-box-containing protein